MVKSKAARGASMYKVLAADDEVWIRRWLEKTIPEVMPA